MAKISLFIQLLESFTKQFIKDVGRAPKTRNELMSIQDDVVRYLNKKKGVPEGPKKPPFQGFTPEVIQGGKSKEGIKSIPVDEQFTTKKINQIDDELDNLSTGEGKYGKMNRNDRENEMIRLQDESSTLQETFNVKSPLVQDDALRIKQGLSTRIKLNSENENAQMVKDLILRKNKEFNSLDRTQQKEILDRIQNQIKESKAKSATNVNPDDEMPFASGGLARVGYADGSYKSEGLFGIPMEDIRKYKKKKRMDRTPPFAIPDDWLEKFLRRFQKTGTYEQPTYEQPMATGGLARVGYAGGRLVFEGLKKFLQNKKTVRKAVDDIFPTGDYKYDAEMAAEALVENNPKFFKNKLYDDLSDTDRMEVYGSVLSEVQNDLAKMLEARKLSKPKKTLEGIKKEGTIDISDPEVADEFSTFIKQSDPEGYKKLEQQIQSDDLFDAEGKLNKKAVLQEVKDSEEKMLLDKFDVTGRKKNASGGIAGQLHMNRPGYAKGREVIEKTILSGPQKSGLPGVDKIIDAIGGAAGISTLGLPKWLISKLMQGGVKSNLAQKYNQLAKENRLRDARQLLTANSPYMGEDPSISSAKRIMREVPTAPSKSRWEIKQSLNQGGSAGSGLNYLLGEDDQNVRTPYQGGIPGLLGE